MIHSIFTVYDTKAQAYLPPFILPRAEMAKRIFSDCINSDDHQFGKHPEDYTLFHLGNWDDDTAEYHLKNAPTSLGVGVEYIRAVDSDQMELLPATEGRSNGAKIRKIQEPRLQPGTEGDNPTE